MDEIKRNDYNLNIPRYVSATTQEAPYDLYSVMTGKVSAKELQAFDDIWEKFPELKGKLLNQTANGYYAFADVDCKEIVFDDPEVKNYLDEFGEVSNEFKAYLIDLIVQHKSSPQVHDSIIKELFLSFEDHELVDVYKVYQAFADNWSEVDSDLARLETEGWGICTEIEPQMITKKDPKTKQTVEVQNGWKGKIMPFELVKKVFFADDFDTMNALSLEADQKASEYEDIWENMDEDAKAALAKEDDETAYDAKKFKPAIKNGDLDADSTKSVKAMLVAMDEEKAARKQIKTISSSLEDKAIQKIQSLTDDEVKELLILKWIEPIIKDIDGVGTGVLNQFVSAFVAMRKKYSDPLSDLSADIEKTGAELKESLGLLTGSDADMEAVKMLLGEL